MEKYTSFTKNNLELLRATMFKEFEARAKELGLDMKFGNIKFQSHEFHMRVDVKVNDPSVTNVIEAKKDSLASTYLKMEGLELNQTFVGMDRKGNAVNLKIVGYNTRKPKNAISLEGPNGEKFMCSVAYVKQQLALRAR